MKKLLFTLAILFQVVVASAHKKTNDPELTVYKQPSKESEVVKVITDSDSVATIRTFNNKWTIVTINKEVGYISSFQLAQHKKQQKAAAIAKAKALNTKQSAAL